MSKKKILKRLIKRKKNRENEFLKKSSLSFIFFRILALSYFPNTQHPATPNTQHPATPQYEIKSQYRVFSQKNPNTQQGRKR